MSDFLEGMTFNPKTGRYIAGLQARVDELENELRGTVTTDYHDSIVAEAMQRVAELESLIRQLKIDAGSWV
jgi:hypothetical protein